MLKEPRQDQTEDVSVSGDRCDTYSNEEAPAPITSRRCVLDARQENVSVERFLADVKKKRKDGTMKIEFEVRRFTSLNSLR